VISVVLPGVQAGLLNLLFPSEPLHIFVDDTPTGLSEAIPKIFTALGEQLPEDWEPGEIVQVEPVEELILKLTAPSMTEHDGIHRAAATAELTYNPADHRRAITSRRYPFQAPLGPVELGEIRWYIEHYYRWPTGVFKTRAGKTEQALPTWGNALYAAALGGESAQEPLEAWRGETGSRRFSVQVDADPPEGSAEDAAALIREAASDLLSLPWEILHDGTGYLSQSANGVRVRRRLPNRKRTTTLEATLPIRVVVRERAAAVNPAWSLARFANERLLIERLLHQGQLQPAYDKARPCWTRPKPLDQRPNEGADYDVAVATTLLGRVLKTASQAAPALDLFVEAQRLFEALGGQGETMASVALADQADCLMELGRLDEAADTYEENIKRHVPSLNSRMNRPWSPPPGTRSAWHIKMPGSTRRRKRRTAARWRL
jgi:tetratricopeptide (TPR) repeat protein